MRIPSWHSDPSADEPEMVEVDDNEVSEVLAWRLHDLRRQIADDLRRSVADDSGEAAVTKALNAATVRMLESDLR